jgi:hypothetical protein
MKLRDQKPALGNLGRHEGRGHVSQPLDPYNPNKKHYIQARGQEEFYSLETNQIPHHLIVEIGKAHLTIPTVHSQIKKSTVQAQQVPESESWEELSDM